MGGQLPRPPFNPEPARERMRGRLAAAVVALLAGTILFSFVLVWLDKITVDEARTLLETTIPAEVALVGSAIGFYFGGRDRSNG